MSRAVARSKPAFEFSAGGIVQNGEDLLMVRVENLLGKQLWTFPKGHIEKGENAEQAALREVEEETGYRCDITKPLGKTQYWFKRDGVLTKKTVTWFLMKPDKKTGEPDAEEILETRWIPFKEAIKLVKYKSDKKTLADMKHL